MRRTYRRSIRRCGRGITSRWNGPARRNGPCDSKRGRRRAGHSASVRYMAMAITIDPKVAPYYDVTFILCAMVFCEDCKREIEYTSVNPPYTDENYYDAAVAMQAAGW